MLLSRDFVGYMAAEVTKRLIDNKMIEAERPRRSPSAFVRRWPRNWASRIA